jgi:hypothetical protein
MCRPVNILGKIMFLDFVHRLMFLKKHNVSETGSVSVLRHNNGGTYSVGSLDVVFLETLERDKIQIGPA